MSRLERGWAVFPEQCCDLRSGTVTEQKCCGRTNFSKKSVGTKFRGTLLMVVLQAERDRDKSSIPILVWDIFVVLYQLCDSESVLFRMNMPKKKILKKRFGNSVNESRRYNRLLIIHFKGSFIRLFCVFPWFLYIWTKLKNPEQYNNFFLPSHSSRKSSYSQITFSTFCFSQCGS